MMCCAKLNSAEELAVDSQTYSQHLRTPEATPQSCNPEEASFITSSYPSHFLIMTKG